MTSYRYGKTRAGSAVVIFQFEGGEGWPQIGAWYADSQNRWIPAAWTKKGNLVDDNTPSALDLVELEE